MRWPVHCKLLDQPFGGDLKMLVSKLTSTLISVMMN